MKSVFWKNAQKNAKKTLEKRPKNAPKTRTFFETHFYTWKAFFEKTPKKTLKERSKNAQKTRTFFETHIYTREAFFVCFYHLASLSVFRVKTWPKTAKKPPNPYDASERRVLLRIFFGEIAFFCKKR